MRQFFLLAVLLGCAAAARGQSLPAQTITTFFVHAWVPQLGPPPHVATTVERKLLEVASLVLDGRFRSAAAQLDAAASSASTGRERLLVAVFRHQVLLRRYRYIGGALYWNSDVVLEGGFAQQYPLFQQAFSVASALPERERRDALGAVEWSSALAVMLDIPAMLRQGAFTNVNDYPGSVQQLDLMVAMARQRFNAATEGASGLRHLSPQDIAVLRHLLAAQEARAKRDIAGARRELDAALAVATPKGAAELRLDRGDVVFRYGDALVQDGALAGLFVTAVLTQGDLGLTALPDSEAEEAQRDWAAAERVFGPVPRLVARRAAGLLARDTEAALRLLGEAARGEGIAAWAAAASRANFEGSRPQLLEAVARARAEDNIGAVASFAEAARIDAAFAGILGNTPRASALLEAAADAHGHGAPRMRAETLLQLAVYYNSIGRADAAIVTGKAAHEAHRRFLARAKEFAAETPTQTPINEAFERGFAGRIDLALGAAYAARAMATGSAVAAAEAEAALAAGDKALRENPVPGDDPALMAANSIAQSISFAVDGARRRRAPCAELRELYAELRGRAEKAGVADLVMTLDLSFADCDPERLAGHRRVLEQSDLVAPVREKLTASPLPVAARTFADRMATQKSVVTLQIQMDILGTTDAWEALERAAVSLAELVRANDSLRSLAPYAEAQRMVALIGKGKAAEALRIEDELHRGWWGAMVPQLRAGVLATALSAEASLCAAADPACDPLRGLLAFERLLFEDRKAGVLRTGVQPLRRATAERAAFEARLAGGGPLTDAEAARLAELRGDGSEAILREPEPTRATVEQVIAALPSATRLIVLFPARDRLLIWHARRGSVRLSSLATKPWDIAAAATAVEYAVTDRVEDAIAPAAAAASAWLEVLEPPLAAGEALIVVAPGALARMPFDVLTVNGHRLATGHPIVYADHLGSIADRRSPDGEQGSALVTGVNGNGLSSAEAEAAAIAQMVGTTPLLGSAVTADAVRERLANARVIHFALHASLSSDNPYDSYLSFGPGGRLRAWELFRSAPAAELITLSACDTGAEAARAVVPGQFGGAPTSLVAFAFAGNARFVVASFWRVKDSIATRVMQEFYRFLKAGDSPAVALQRTKQALVADAAPAYYYANFFVAARSVGAITGNPSKEPR